MIAGLEEFSGGDIRIGSRVVNDLPPRAQHLDGPAMRFVASFFSSPQMNLVEARTARKPKV